MGRRTTGKSEVMASGMTSVTQKEAMMTMTKAHLKICNSR